NGGRSAKPPVSLLHHGGQRFQPVRLRMVALHTQGRALSRYLFRLSRRLIGLVGGRGRELHRDPEPAAWARGEGEGSIMGLDDTLDDRQAQADPGVIAAYPLGAALKRLGESRDELRAERLAAVFDSEGDEVGTDGGIDLHD